MSGVAIRRNVSSRIPFSGSISLSDRPSMSSMVRKWAPSTSCHRVHGHDTGMTQRGERLGLALERKQQRLVAGHRRLEDLQRHMTMESRILGDIDLPCTAPSEALHNAVVPEGLTHHPHRAATIDSRRVGGAPVYTQPTPGGREALCRQSHTRCAD